MGEMQIGYVTRGNAEFGMGHIFRCLQLAVALSRRFPKAEHTMELGYGEQAQRTVRENFSGQIVDRHPGIAPLVHYDLLIVDQLASDPPEMQMLRNHAHCLVALDDTGLGRWFADIAINALYMPQTLRPAASATRVFDGLCYLGLDPRFAGSEYRVKESVSQVLITQGGSDTYGIVPCLVRSLSNWLAKRRDVTLHVHTGPAFSHQQQLAEALRLVNGAVCHERPADLPTVFAQMDLCIAAGGITACEIAATGVPLVLVTAERKELETARHLAGAGAARLIGLWGQEQVEPLLAAVSELAGNFKMRAEMSARARQAVDGRGLERILDIICANLFRPSGRREE